MLIQLDISRSHLICCRNFLYSTVCTNGEVNLLVLCNTINNAVGILIRESVWCDNFFKVVIAIRQSLDMQFAVLACFKIVCTGVKRAWAISICLWACLCAFGECQTCLSAVRLIQQEFCTCKRSTNTYCAYFLFSSLGKDNFTFRLRLFFVDEDHLIVAFHLDKCIVLIIVVNAIVLDLKYNVFVIGLIACRRSFFYPVVSTFLYDINFIYQRCSGCRVINVAWLMIKILSINCAGHISIWIIRIICLSLSSFRFQPLDILDLTFVVFRIICYNPCQPEFFRLDGNDIIILIYLVDKRKIIPVCIESTCLEWSRYIVFSRRFHKLVQSVCNYRLNNGIAFFACTLVDTVVDLERTCRTRNSDSVNVGIRSADYGNTIITFFGVCRTH